jgi:predicted nucleotidyltransferase component of viral defense system
MSAEAMRLKAKVRAVAREKNIAAQAMLQNYMFERFLERLVRSPYHDKFILKGGMLIASMLGLETRSTMDLDTTVRGFPFDEEHLAEALRAICEIPVDDRVGFQFKGLNPIRKDDMYGGFCASLAAVFDTIRVPLSVDITCGDVITPTPVKYALPGLFEPDRHLELWAYNIETILAEKTEAILSRGTFGTRPRDFYDVYVLSKLRPYSPEIFKEAFIATSAYRAVTWQLNDIPAILEKLRASQELQGHWKKYQQTFAYARDIAYEDAVAQLEVLLNTITNS